MPLSDGRGRVGYLLKDRVASLDVLVDALRTITAGGTVLDPQGGRPAAGGPAGLSDLGSDNRRVLAVLAWLKAR